MHPRFCSDADPRAGDSAEGCLSAPIIAFFNNKGGVGKTTLVYHLAWKFADLGLPVVAVDLDPQSNLPAAFLSDEEIEKLWDDDGGQPKTVLGAVQKLVQRLGDIEAPAVEEIAEN